MRKLDPVRRRTILVTGLIAAAILVLLLPIQGRTKADRGKTNEERLAFLNSLGWEAEEVPCKEQMIQLPRVFPEVLLKYNELQEAQGFDLTKYAGKTVTMYCYRLTQPEGADETFATLYVYKNRIIGGDIHSTALDGEMRGLR
ncbi:MAG: DUF4830 domain-containing protein [Oscillospiraceae bacterium]|nr:DUF4830 domain-containing protein [Oscillospiraceae bacterium]